MQLDIDMSPPANIITLRLGSTHLTFDPNPRPWIFPVRRSNETINHIFDLVTLTFDLDLQGRPLTLTHATFDLDPCDTWPQILPVRWSNETWNNVFWPSDLDLWPMTLTLKINLRVIHINILTKFHDPELNGCWNLIFGLVTFGPITDRRPDRRKALHMSPPCIRPGGLNETEHVG